MIKTELENLIISCLDEDSANEEALLERFNELESIYSRNFYVKLLYTLTHLEFSEEEAEKVWFKVIANRDDISSRLGRNVGFRVALLDYFINQNRKITNPKIIEIHLYFETEKLVLVDELTGVFNRRYFNNALEREIKIAQRYNRLFSILIFDIDNFKSINDRFGHSKGDQVLQDLGKIFMEFSRQEDTICRYGGEEFVLILPETNGHNAYLAGEKIRQAFHEMSVEGEKLSISGGVACFPRDAENYEKLIRVADENLYSAKSQGKNCIIYEKKSRRKESRFPFKLKLEYMKLNNGHTVVENSYSRDISLGGISLFFTDRVQIGEHIRIRLLRGDQRVPLELDIVITWVEAVPEDNNYHAGGYFQTLYPSDKDRIRKEIDRYRNGR